MRRRSDRGHGREARLATFLRAARGEILAHWTQSARELEELRGLSRGQRVDHLPLVLSRLADIAEEIEAGRPVRTRSDAAARHAHDRLDQGFDLSTVVRELALLRDSVIALWGRISPMDLGPLHLLDRVMDDAVTTSVDEYVRSRSQTLLALDRVATAGLGARSIDELFGRLLEAFECSTESVDTLAILVIEEGRLVLRSAIGLEPTVSEHFTVRAGPPDLDGESFAAMVIRLGHAVHLSEDELRARVWPETSQAGQVRALYGVPMFDDGRLIGVAHMGSHTAPAFAQLDRRLFESLTLRATAGMAHLLANELAQRRAAELASSEQRFRATFANAPVGIAHVGLDGTWLRVNQRYCQILGYDQDTLRALRYQDMAHPDDLVRDGAAARALIEGRLQSYAAEKCYHRSDGTTVWVRLTASLVHEDTVGPGYFIAILEDITEYKAVESALRAGEEQARMALARERDAHEEAERALAALDSLLAAAPAGITIVDTQFRYLRVNETLAALDGIPLDRYLGHTVREVLGERADIIEQRLQAVIDTGQAFVGEDVIAWPPDDPVRPRSVLVTLFPVRAQDGETLGVGGIIMDITERKKMEDDLRASERQAQRSIDLRDQVLAVVSHDLRNPLGAVRMAASLMLQRGRLDGEERKYMEVIDRAATRMERLISDLLDLAIIESGRLALDRQAHDLGAILHDACEQLQMIARSKAIEIRCPAPDPPISIACDRERILQVLGNLIGNALKFGGANDVVEIEARREGSELVVGVADTGPGVPEDQVEHLFEAYWTTARSGAEGTGLGLFISKGIVEAHGGRIGAHNRTPRGARFWFALPASPG